MLTVNVDTFQIYYYHNVKCRVEMFDKDIIMLQVRLYQTLLDSTDIY